MTIEIISNLKSSFPLELKDLQDGHAYVCSEEEEDVIYVCNRYSNVVAFSLDGGHIVDEDSDNLRFREINLKVEVC